MEMPHPAIITSGPQLAKVIEEMETGAYPLPECAVWRDDLPRELAVRLALATGASMEQIEAGPSEYADDDTPPDPQPEPEPDPQVAEDEADAIIRHTHEDGTLVYGTSKGDGTAEILKANRFRWFPSIKLWGVAQSRDHLAKRWQINAAADALRAAGFKVRVEIDDTPRDVTEVKADRADRLDTRYDRLTTKAQRNAAEVEARMARANEIVSARNGQPRLNGHHSARRWDADQKRVEQNDQAAKVAYRKAEYAAAAASVVGSADAYRELPPVIIRRIDKTEADLRKTQHQIDGTRPANDWRGAYYAPEAKPASGEWLEQLQARKTFLEHQLAADRALLAEHEASGYVRLARETVHKGDRVFWGATWGDGLGGALVTRTNPKTVTLDRRSYPRTLPYERIKRVECPHDDKTVTVTIPKRQQARPKPEPVTVERPPEREAPLTVDGSTELFSTPPAVVERMIAAAQLGPDMTVLEPSAGLGAIATPVARLVSLVACIERNQKVADRLRDTGTVDGVTCADFLEVQPGPLLSYDRVLMNPPFKNQADIAHVMHALRFVKPGGRLVAVMSAGVEFHQNKTAEAFRALVAGRGGSIVRLPDGSFKQSGTGIRTVLVTIPVPAEAAQPAPAPSPVPAGPAVQASLFDDEETAA